MFLDTSHILTILDQLESALLNAILQSQFPRAVSLDSAAQINRRFKHNSIHSLSEHGTNTPNQRGSTTRLLSSEDRIVETPRPHERDFNNSTDSMLDLDSILMDRVDGIEIALERAKHWSTYCKELVNYIRTRTQLEQEHWRRISSLADSSNQSLPKRFSPLVEIFEQSFQSDMGHCARAKQTLEYIRDRVIEVLECRRKEHDTKRTSLKNDWNKILKNYQETQDAHSKAVTSFKQREDGLSKARDLRDYNVTVEASKRRKEFDRRTRAIEEAVNRKDDAERNLHILRIELHRKAEETKYHKAKVIKELRELSLQCEQTTKACTNHYFNWLSELYAPLPDSYSSLAYEARSFQPGSVYMSFLHSLPSRSNSSTNFLRPDRPSLHAASQMTSYRRNALQPDDPVTLPSRIGEECRPSDAALSHSVQRTVQPCRCMHCDALSLLHSLQCVRCGAQWHKGCYPKSSQWCEESAPWRLGISTNERRTSIFGVALKDYVESEDRKTPRIVELCIDNLQERGMQCKGIYRTCGVKSKVEEICGKFERSDGSDDIPLDDVNPMNLASVVKLYLRKLPDPLLTFEAYDDFVKFGKKHKMANSEEIVEELRNLCRQLPGCNYETLKILMLHLNRVTWFEHANLMTASNLSTVITPSLAWPRNQTHDAVVDAQFINRTIELIIAQAHKVFGVDKKKDWNEFFTKYRGNATCEPYEDEEGESSEEVDDERQRSPYDGLDQATSTSATATEGEGGTTPDLLRTTKKKTSSGSFDADRKMVVGSVPDESPSWLPMPSDEANREHRRRTFRRGSSQSFDRQNSTHTEARKPSRRRDESETHRRIQRRQSTKEYAWRSVDSTGSMGTSTTGGNGCTNSNGTSGQRTPEEESIHNNSNRNTSYI
ncbi:hypothetical protein WR25_16146 isoform B [Diploscapter pachys]|nr:hypothetical protein WR25_16146 isoform B [Diploscapter pachys]